LPAALTVRARPAQGPRPSRGAPWPCGSGPASRTARGPCDDARRPRDGRRYADLMQEPTSWGAPVAGRRGPFPGVGAPSAGGTVAARYAPRRAARAGAALAVALPLRSEEPRVG